MNRKKVWINISIILIIVVVIGLYGIIGFKYEQTMMSNKNFIKADKIKQQANIEKKYADDKKDIMNILLIGSDAREGDKKSRSDTIMIVSLDKHDNSVRLVSVIRDTYAKIPGYDKQKINHAFAYGGPKLLMKSVEENFDIPIHRYIVVSFNAFKDIIDIMGGIDVELDKLEVTDLNNCMYGLKEKNIIEVSNTGMNHLNGTQALAYARMRHNGKGAYDRSKRQRQIVQIALDKAKEISLFKYPSIAKIILRSMETNISFNEVLKLSYMVYSFKNINVEQMQVPPKDICTNELMKTKGWVVKYPEEEVNKILNDFIYEGKAYIPKEKSKQK